MWQYPPPQHELTTADLRFEGTVRGILERRGLTFCRRCARSASAWHRTSSCSSRRQAASRGTCASTSPAAATRSADSCVSLLRRLCTTAGMQTWLRLPCYQVLATSLGRGRSCFIPHKLERVLHKVLHRKCVPINRIESSAPVYAMHMSVSATAMLLRTAGSAAPRSCAAKWGTHALASASSPRHSFPSAVHACAWNHRYYRSC